jgi:hypothetical protein
MAGDAGEQRRGEGVLVGRRPDRLAAPLLRRGIGRRKPRRVSRLRERFVHARAREAEVGEVGVLAVGARDEQDVLGLDVAMHDAAPVRPVQRPRDLRDDHQRTVDVEPAAIADEVPDVEVAQGRREIQKAVLVTVVPDREHVRMGHSLGGQRLALEAMAELLVLRQPAGQHLHGRRTLVLEVDGFVDAAHAALAELRLEAEAATDDVPDAQGAAPVAHARAHGSSPGTARGPPDGRAAAALAPSQGEEGRTHSRGGSRRTTSISLQETASGASLTVIGDLAGRFAPSLIEDRRCGREPRGGRATWCRAARAATGRGGGRG